MSKVQVVALTDSLVRLCRTGPAARLQLWLLSPPDHPHFHNMHGLQRPAWFMARPFLRPRILHHRQLHL